MRGVKDGLRLDSSMKMLELEEDMAMSTDMTMEILYQMKDNAPHVKEFFKGIGV